MLRLSCEHNTSVFSTSTVATGVVALLLLPRQCGGCCDSFSVVVLLLPRRCCCCFSKTFTNAAFGTAVYNAVFSLQAVMAVVIV
jgi:hypothetical protein